jgi:phage baseplate assembly protein gpV
MGYDEIAILRNIFRVGTVSSVQSVDSTARVIFADKKDEEGNPLLSAPLKVVQNSNEVWFPDVGRLVLCLFIPNGESDGVIVGGL